MKKPPKSGEPTEKKVKDCTYYWCTHHWLWQFHKRSNCHLALSSSNSNGKGKKFAKKPQGQSNLQPAGKSQCQQLSELKLNTNLNTVAEQYNYNMDWQCQLPLQRPQQKVYIMLHFLWLWVLAATALWQLGLAFCLSLLKQALAMLATRSKASNFPNSLQTVWQDYKRNHMASHLVLMSTSASTPYDSDSYLIGVDNCATACMTNKMEDFIKPPKKIHQLVCGVKGSTVCQYQGTAKWRWLDDSGFLHKAITPDTFYCESLPFCILSPQHWSQPHLKQGLSSSLASTDHISTVLMWMNKAKGIRYKTIPLNPQSNISTFN